MKTGFNSLKEEYERNIEKGAIAFYEEYLAGMEKISCLKAEYLKAVENANELKDELMQMFEQASLFNRLQTEKI